MPAYSHRFYVNCTEAIDLLNITHDVKRAICDSQIKNGLACVLVPLGAGGVAILENDPSVQEAFRDLLVSLVPETSGERPVRHSKTGAPHAHLRALFTHPSLTVPVINGELGIGHWQELILYDLDDRIARREFLVHIVDGGAADGASGASARGGPRGGGQSLPPGRAKAV